MKNLAYYIDNLANLKDNHFHEELKLKNVAVQAPIEPTTLQALYRAGAIICKEPCMAEIAFFDARYTQASDALAAILDFRYFMQTSLVSDGVAFAILQTGAADHNFDIVNQIINTGSGIFPTWRYLVDSLLVDCTLRMLDDFPSHDPDVHTHLIRITPKRPSLILIIGGGHSGKTSFARDLISLDPQIHVSNDYIYCELHRLAASGGAHMIPAEITANLGSGDGDSCYKFNRRLEQDNRLLRAYASLLIRLIPRNRRVVSVDLDFGKPEPIAELKSILIEAGFSVWIAAR